MSTSPIERYTTAVNKIEAMINEMKELLIKGVINIPANVAFPHGVAATSSGQGMLQSNRDEAKKIWDELVEFIKTPNTGYAAFDAYIMNLMGVRFHYDTGATFARCIWDGYAAMDNTSSFIPWVSPFMRCLAHGDMNGIDLLTDVDTYIQALTWVFDDKSTDFDCFILGNYIHGNRDIHPSFVAARTLIESTRYLTDNFVSAENKRLQEQIDEDRLEIQGIKVRQSQKFKALTAENKRLQAQIDEDHLEIQQLKAKFAPELIEYDYDEISSRLDPIRDELKMMQRVFGRAVRLRYMAPVAIAVPLK